MISFVVMANLGPIELAQYKPFIFFWRTAGGQDEFLLQLIYFF